MSSNSSQNIQVTIEFGHHATFRKKPSAEGYTHDWTVFVRGPEGSKIQHYVEKVVFQLHESFSKPKRVVKDPPYQVSESGYAGFNLPIVIYFRSKEKPKKLSFDYDLFLHADQCTNHVHYEQLTFTNPNEEFRQKLLKACGQPMGTPSSLMDPSSVGSVSKGESNGKKVKSSSSSSKDISSSKEKSKHKSSNISGNSSKPLTPQSAPVASKEIRSATSTPSSTPIVPKEPKSRGKEAQKRPSTSSPPDGEMSGKKLKRSSSVSSEHSKDKHTSHKSDKHKHSKDSSKKKSKHEHKSNKNGKKEKHSSSSFEKKEKSSKHSSSSEHKPKKSSSDSLHLPLDIPTKTALLSPLKISSDEDDEEEERTMKKEDSDSVSSPCSDLSSSSSSISLSPLPEAERKKNSSKYDSLMADLGDPDTSDDDFNVPIPTVPLSPLDKSYTETKPSTSSSTKSPKTVSDSKSPKKVKSSSSTSQPKKSNSKPEKTKSKETKVKKDKESKSSKGSKSNSKEREPSVVTSQNGIKEENKGDAVAMNGETISSLWALHDRIMASRDSEMLDEVVGLIQETGLFKVTDTTFDFDLCVLDKETVQKIFKCVSSVS